MTGKIRTNGRDFLVPVLLAQALIASRRVNWLPRRPARANAEGDAAAEGDEGGAAGMTTVSSGGADYQVPTELVMALVAGLPLTVSVGDQNITGSFCSDAAEVEEEADEATPDAAPASVPMAFNGLGAGRRGVQRRQEPARGNAAPAQDQATTARVNALEDAVKGYQAQVLGLEAKLERKEIEPALRSALGTRFNAALPTVELKRMAVINRWPHLAEKAKTESGPALDARWDILAGEIAAGNYDDLRNNGGGSAPPQNPDELVEQARKRLNERLQNGKGA